MLTTSDIGDLFAAMRISYGAQWKHGQDAIPVWRRALSQHSPKRIQEAAVKALEIHVKHPPTLPEFMQILSPPSEKPRATTYISPPTIDRANRVLNHVLLKIVLDCNGVDQETMQRLSQFKRGLAEEVGPDMTENDRDECRRQLIGLANHKDSQKRAEEREKARRRIGAG